MSLKFVLSTRGIRNSDFLIRNISALLIFATLLPMSGGLFAAPGIAAITKGFKPMRTVQINAKFNINGLSFESHSAVMYSNGDIGSMVYSSSSKTWGNLYFNKTPGQSFQYSVETDLSIPNGATQSFARGAAQVANEARMANINNVIENPNGGGLLSSNAAQVLLDPYGKGAEIAANYVNGKSLSPFPDVSYNGPGSAGVGGTAPSALPPESPLPLDNGAAVRSYVTDLVNDAHNQYVSLKANLESYRGEIVNSTPSLDGTPVKPQTYAQLTETNLQEIDQANLMSQQYQTISEAVNAHDAQVAANMDYAKAKLQEMGVEPNSDGSFEQSVARGGPDLDSTGSQGNTAGSGKTVASGGACTGPSCVNVGALVVGIAVGFLANWIGSKLFAGLSPRWASVANQAFSLGTGIGASIILSSVFPTMDLGALGVAINVLGIVLIVVAIVVLIVSIVMAIMGDNESTRHKLWTRVQTHLMQALAKKESFTRVIAFMATQKSELTKLKKKHVLPLSDATATKYAADRDSLNKQAEKLHKVITEYEKNKNYVGVGRAIFTPKKQVDDARKELDQIVPKVLDLDTLLAGYDAQETFRAFEKERVDYCDRLDLYQGFITYSVPTRNAIRAKKNHTLSAADRAKAAADLEKFIPEAIKGLLYTIKHLSEKIDDAKNDLKDTEQRLKDKRDIKDDKNPVVLKYRINSAHEAEFLAQPFARLIAKRVAGNYAQYGFSKREYDMVLDFATSKIGIDSAYRMCTVDVK